MRPPKGPIGVHRLWIEPLGERDYLICLDHNSAEAMYVAFNIILEVAIGDWTREFHFGTSVKWHICSYDEWFKCLPIQSFLAENRLEASNPVRSVAATNRL